MHSITEESTETQAAPCLPSTLAELVTEHPDWENAPKIKVTCPHCDQTHWHNQLLASVFPNTSCDACTDMHRQSLYGDAYPDPNQREREILEANLPPALVDTDPNRIPPNLKQVVNWQPNPKGLWITGNTRTFKSRAISALVKKLIKQNNTPRTFFHGSFHDELLSLAKYAQPLLQFKLTMQATPILVIDDLFAQKLSEFSESFLFDLLDARTLHYLPTIISTQVTAKDAKSIFTSTLRLEAFFARIKEHFTLVNSNP
jgi:hypothetical protein